MSPQWIVTAAHCVDHAKTPRMYQGFKITLGEHTRSKREGYEQVLRVASIIVHPDYNKPSAINNDIGKYSFFLELAVRIKPTGKELASEIKYDFTMVVILSHPASHL